MTIIPSKERLLAVYLKGFLNGGGIRTTAGSTPLYRKVFEPAGKGKGMGLKPDKTE